MTVDLCTPRPCLEAVCRILDHFGWPGGQRPAPAPKGQGEARDPT